MVEDVLEGWYSMKNMEETNDDDDATATLHMSRSSKFQYLKDKFLKPTPKEKTINPRSRSAILRVAEKLC